MMDSLLALPKSSSTSTPSARGTAAPRVGRAPRVSSARLLWGEPPFRNSAGRTFAQRAGLRYEKKVLAHLREVFPTTLVSPWIEYGVTEPYSCLCQPDAVAINQRQRLVTIIEVKYSHTLDAYKQLALKYLPVLQCLISSSYRFNLLEVTRALDPTIKFPKPILFVEDLEHFLSTPTSRIGVYTWKR